MKILPLKPSKILQVVSPKLSHDNVRTLDTTSYVYVGALLYLDSLKLFLSIDIQTIFYYIFTIVGYIGVKTPKTFSRTYKNSSFS